MSVVELESRELALEAPSGLWRDAWFTLRRNPGAIVGFILVGLFIFVAIFAPLLAPFDPREQDLSAVINGCCPGPSGEHWFGIDQLGRDEFSRILYGARYSLLIGVVAVTAGLSIGVVLGATAGYIGGFVDSLIMRMMDIMLAIPGLLLAIGIVAMLGPGLFQIMIAVGVTNVPIFARLLRGSVLAQRENDFVLAARAVGVKRRTILVSHILPNAMSPVIVQGTLAMATAIIDVAGLGFLGLGPQDPSTPEWGTMLTDVERYLQSAVHLAIVPGVANGVSVDIARGETLGIVGESGCGKSVTSLAVLGLLARNGHVQSGRAMFEGRDLIRQSDRALRGIRGREIAMIFQDPMTSLNPVLTIGKQIREALATHFGMRGKEANSRAVELLDRVGIPSANKRIRDYPHQFSGGMRQRAMIEIGRAHV